MEDDDDVMKEMESSKILNREILKGRGHRSPERDKRRGHIRQFSQSGCNGNCQKCIWRRNIQAGYNIGGIQWQVETNFDDEFGMIMTKFWRDIQCQDDEITIVNTEDWTRERTDWPTVPTEHSLKLISNLKQSSYKDSTLIMQLLRDNMTLWCDIFFSFLSPLYFVVTRRPFSSCAATPKIVQRLLHESNYQLIRSSTSDAKDTLTTHRTDQKRIKRRCLILKHSSYASPPPCIPPQ